MKPYLFAIALILIASIMVYVRSAQFDASRLTRPEIRAQSGDTQGRKTFMAIRALASDPRVVLRDLESLVLATPRTKKVAGGIAEDEVIYETRSFVFGFPDYTLISLLNVEGQYFLAIYGSARFGKKKVT